MVVVLKPQTREGAVIWGDGDDGNLISVTSSSDEGYLLFQFKPSPKMKWNKQIQPNEYDLYDGLVKKKYREDLCIQLCPDPDFPTWLILCDYRGKESTPAFEKLVKLKDLLIRNRVLETRTHILESERKKKLYKERQKALHGEAEDLLVEERVRRWNDAARPRNAIDITPPSSQDQNVEY